MRRRFDSGCTARARGVCPRCGTASTCLPHMHASCKDATRARGAMRLPPVNGLLALHACLPKLPLVVFTRAGGARHCRPATRAAGGCRPFAWRGGGEKLTAVSTGGCWHLGWHWAAAAPRRRLGRHTAQVSLSCTGRACRRNSLSLQDRFGRGCGGARLVLPTACLSAAGCRMGRHHRLCGALLLRWAMMTMTWSCSWSTLKV